MDTKTYTTRTGEGRDAWPPGPWDNEPDKMQWPDPATGLPCLAVRGPLGAWCGYVGVPPGHPYHGKDYNDLEHLDAHGGLTFCDRCQPGRDERHGVCHVPGAGEPQDVWWFGFDCAHYGDVMPAMLRFEGMDGLILVANLFTGSTYRTLDYVQSECTRLAAQLVGGVWRWGAK